MDDPTIAGLNNFRQLTEGIEATYPSEALNNQVASPACSDELNLIQNSKDTIIIFDTDGRYLNYTGTLKYNLIANDVIWMTSSDIFDNEAAVEIVARVNEVTRSCKAANTKNAINWRGYSILFRNHTCPIRNADGLIVAAGSIPYDLRYYRSQTECN